MKSLTLTALSNDDVGELPWSEVLGWAGLSVVYVGAYYGVKLYAPEYQLIAAMAAVGVGVPMVVLWSLRLYEYHQATNGGDA